jgi:hypothetical protein
MKANDLEQFVQIMKMLAKVFSPAHESTLDNETLEIYFQVFKNFSLDDFHKAAEGVIRNRVYSGMPKPAELINELSSINELALNAWIEIEDAGYSAINSKDPIAQKVWRNLNRRYREAKTTDLHYIQREFERRYKAQLNVIDRPNAIISDKIKGLLPTILKSIK